MKKRDRKMNMICKIFPVLIISTFLFISGCQKEELLPLKQDVGSNLEGNSGMQLRGYNPDPEVQSGKKDSKHVIDKDGRDDDDEGEGGKDVLDKDGSDDDEGGEGNGSTDSDSILDKDGSEDDDDGEGNSRG